MNTTDPLIGFAMAAPGLDAPRIAAATKAVGVGIYEVRGSEQSAIARSCLLLGFGRTDEPAIANAVLRLRKLFLKNPYGVSARSVS